MNITSERRRYRRHVVDAAVALILRSAEARSEARLLDLSLGGCFLLTATPPAVDAPVSLTFYRSGRRLCSAAGMVVRSAVEGFGVRFVEVNENLRDLVYALGLAGAQRRAELLAEVASAEITLG